MAKETHIKTDKNPLLAGVLGSYHIYNENAAVLDTPETPKIEAKETPDDEHPAGGKGATQMLPDNDVEGTSKVAGMTDSLKSLASRRSPNNSDS